MQILQGNVLFSGKIYTDGKKIYTTAGRDKFKVCLARDAMSHSQMLGKFEYGLPAKF